MTPDFDTLIPELPGWNQGNGISVDDWIGCVGNFELAIGFSRLFWPEFAEHDDCVFWADFSPESYRGFMEQCNGNKQAVEAVMNHLHILTIFGDPDLSPTRDQIVYVGNRLRETWDSKLRRDFPERMITVSFPDDFNEELLDYQITFFQERGSEGGQQESGEVRSLRSRPSD